MFKLVLIFALMNRADFQVTPMDGGKDLEATYQTEEACRKAGTYASNQSGTAIKIYYICVPTGAAYYWEKVK